MAKRKVGAKKVGLRGKAKRKKKTVSPRSRRGAAARAKRRAAGGPKRKVPPRPKPKRIRESETEQRERAVRVMAALMETYPEAQCALRHRSALELLVATILSAQCTDERVNQVTPDLFRRYPDARALAEAKQDELETMIRSTGFFRNKAKSLIGVGRAVRDDFGGQVPDTMDELLQLPGVARKTANCVLGTWFGKNEGIVVDTHVGRLALRLELLTSARDDKDAVKIEHDLTKLFPPESWTYLAHALIQHGREVCQARRPRCSACELSAECPSAEKFE